MPTIYLVRHAQASFGARDYDKLSTLGEQQAVALGTDLAARGIRADLVVAGSMRRHEQTATLAGFTAEIDHGYDEFDHDQVIVAHKPAYKARALMIADLARTGNPKRAFQEMFTAATQRWIDGGAGYDETFQAFCDRSEAAVRRTAARLGKGETALVFTSGGPIAAVVSRLLSGGDGLWARLNPVTINTAITKVVSGRSGLTMVSYNEHGHFDGSERLTYR
ncbi:histidine phosphatase family protein [Kribbella sandramycini]|uniref:Broad specificity phosphatase PhoE n=1 Tax=Kribbella sandramycini TaxID=60450 RepID=A0A7Y4L005_9ACTN|nr:histidine phosphatase family protein [Kribbella sandramycini]MBB6565517.1 broad specificity phosphatase PhoE [Kribbella sandramycini]NOL41784.1 histidine phosphatase family protein [Kribbella sandramycini]